MAKEWYNSVESLLIMQAFGVKQKKKKTVSKNKNNNNKPTKGNIFFLN